MGQVNSAAESTDPATQRIAITGASGFIGRAAVAEARARGIAVVALYRSTQPSEWASDAGITPVRLDLAAEGASDALRAALDTCTALIHAAAHLGDDTIAIGTDTARATRSVLSALEGHAARLVLVSSIVVYDTMQLRPGDTLDEDCPQEIPATARDAYTASKLAQEATARAARKDLWILRPGVVYGPGRSWNALLGIGSSRLFLAIDGGGQLPLTHVTHTAQALVSAALRDPSGPEALNLVDDDLPDRASFVAAHRQSAGWPRRVVTVPFGAWLALARLLSPLAGKLPGLLREPVLRARLMPLYYPNTRLRARLGGADTGGFHDMLRQSIKTDTQ